MKPDLVGTAIRRKIFLRFMGISDAIALMENLVKKELPTSMSYDWTDLICQEILAGNTAIYIFPLCVLFVFLTLAAQDESWSLPFTVILIVPLVLAAGAGAEMRQALGTAVFFGMLGMTFFGALFTPVFYVVVRWLTDRRR
jgi:multidrug efflux pump subunit AcrB